MNRQADSRRSAPDRLALNEEFNSLHRGESPMQSLDRNWTSLLQELRVVQTGLQLLTGFLLILPFQDKFLQLPAYDKAIYMVTMVASISATILVTSPVAMHRLLFRRRALLDLVTAAHRAALAGLLLLGVALTGVVVLITDVVVGPAAAVVVGILAVASFVAIWVIHPLLLRRRGASAL
ncbi:DUF6328 family protein [Rhodococcus cercidiphylli]|uniref:DUF6328 family protein n=1 Tax=Rhodococcus cercidiphylli TaxID=489916 RepID=A0ABU4AV18_9NOCA|nr:DUF6328 family protein [Rhodococcus cercidiphylli]MDV6230086.1 DUF6328 family protein [Rhodococcus cercidiphylli]